MSIGWRSAILLAALFPLTPATTTTELDTRLGRIRGKLESSSTGRPYHAFYSIPYAKPPIGERRFRVIIILYVLLRQSMVAKAYNRRILIQFSDNVAFF